MNVLLVGSGAREHAMVWKLSQSPQVSTLWVAPGNPGIAQEEKTQNVPISATDIPALLQFAEEKHIDLTIIGPELPLSLGIVDAFQAKGHLCLGPKKAAASLETSKAFAKAFMQRHDIPSAQYAEFTDRKVAETYLEKLEKLSFPQVIKADGLAAGKGVIIAENLVEGKNAVQQLLQEIPPAPPFKKGGDKNGTVKKGGDKNGAVKKEEDKKIIIEDFLEGFEVSFIVLTDGKSIIPLATAQDNKRRNNGNAGPNTGGMGACSPAPHMNEKLEQRIMNEIIIPTLEGMQEEGCPYEGFLFAGLMISPSGAPRVLEFNCRLGDPETQAILMRLQSDFFDLCYHAANKTLSNIFSHWNSRPALSLILAASSYPEASVEHATIHGFPTKLPTHTKIFHAGTRLELKNENQQLMAHGGRVLCISALGETLTHAREIAYSLAKDIHWDGGVHYRTDIGDNFEKR